MNESADNTPAALCKTTDVGLTANERNVFIDLFFSSLSNDYMAFSSTRRPLDCTSLRSVSNFKPPMIINPKEIDQQSHHRAPT